MSDRFTEALRLASLGYSVFPCNVDKEPYTKNGVHDATTNADQITKWWTDHPENNIGLSNGGLVVIDVDMLSKHTDPKPNPWLPDEPDKANSLTRGPTASTPSGGRHYVFRLPEGKCYRNTTSELAPGVDV